MLRKSKPAWICAWLTTLAVLLSALMPALTQASRSSDVFSNSICTSAGLSWLDSNQQPLDQASGQTVQHLSGEHCIWCSAQPIDLNPSPTVLPVLALPFAIAHPPAYALPQVRRLPWAMGSPRAPPHLT